MWWRIILCLICLSRSQGLVSLHSCQDDAGCDNNIELDYLPPNKTLFFNLNGDASFEQLRHGTEKGTFQGSVALRRLGYCRIYVELTNFSLGESMVKDTENLVVKFSNDGLKSICSAKKAHTAENEIAKKDRGFEDDKGEKTKHTNMDNNEKDTNREKSERFLTSLGVNIVSAVVNFGFKIEESISKEFEVVEKDNFGQCSTRYSVQNSSNSERILKKYRNLKTCGNAHQNIAIESGNLIWSEEVLGNFVDESIFECKQVLIDGKLSSVHCFHNVSVPDGSAFTSTMNLTSSGPSEIREKDPEIMLEKLVIIYDQDLIGNPNTHNMEEYKRVESLLLDLCSETAVDLNYESIAKVPSILSILNRISTENIVDLFYRIDTGSFCKTNQYFRNLFMSLLRDATSPAATSAKCQIMKKNQDFYFGWAASIANTLSPNSETLKNCAGLLNLPNWQESVLGVSRMVGKFSSSRCLYNAESHPECGLGSVYEEISTSLWLKSRNCVNSRPDYQEMALWAIVGLGNLNYHSDDVTDTLFVCIESPEASIEVKIAALRAFAKKKCPSKISSLLEVFVFDQTQNAELRMEAFKTLFQCDKKVSEKLIQISCADEEYLQSRQVTSYIQSYRGCNSGISGILKFSRHFDFQLDSILKSAADDVISGDVIFDDSFLPSSISLSLKSKLIESLGSFANIEIRQKNLEEVLQPIFGPEGISSPLKNILHDFMLDVFQYMKNDTKSEKSRMKRNLDVREIFNKMKSKISKPLKTAILAGFGDHHQYFGSRAFQPFASDLDSTFDDFAQSAANTILLTLANYELSTGFSWAPRSGDFVTWSFLGYSLKLGHHQCVLGTAEVSSQVNLFSLFKSFFSPSIDAVLTPRIGAYSSTTMEFQIGTDILSATSSTMARTSLDLILNVQQQEEEYHLNIDLPSTSYHGFSKAEYTSLERKFASTSDDIFKAMKLETMKENDKYVCDPGVFENAGLKLCSSSWTSEEEKRIFSYSGYKMSKTEDEIEAFKVVVSTKDYGPNSYFLTAESETLGPTQKRTGNLILGVSYAPHATFRLTAESGNHKASLESTIVNDDNLKRLEAHSKIGDIEYGLKAEVLLVQDGAQLSIKPRLVISHPSRKEDSLIVGYMAHYSSDKHKSITVDLVSDGSLKESFDVAIKGTTEYRCKRSKECSVNLKNVHFISPEMDVALEVSLTSKLNEYVTNSQITYNNDVVMLNAAFTTFPKTDSTGSYKFTANLLNPGQPQRDGKFSFELFSSDRKISNALSISTGHESNLWTFNALHSTDWDMIFYKPSGNRHMRNLLIRLIEHGQNLNLTNIIQIDMPSSSWDWKLNHNFLVAENSIENKILVLQGGEQYAIESNCYDQSTENFKYNIQMKINFPSTKFQHMDTLMKRSEGDIVGQSLTTMPSGKVYRSHSRIKHQEVVDSFLLELSHDTEAQEDSGPFRISFRNIIETSSSSIGFKLSLDTPDPLVLVELSVKDRDKWWTEAFFKTLLKDVVDTEVRSRFSSSDAETGLSIEYVPQNKLVKCKILIERHISGGAAFLGETELISTQNPPAFEPIVIKALSSLLIHHPRFYTLKNEVNIIGWHLLSEMKAELGTDAGDPQVLNVYIRLPDDSKYEGKASFVFDFDDKEQNLETLAQITFPTGLLYKLSLSGRSSFESDVLAEAELQTEIDSPFTKKIFLRTHARNVISENQNRDFIFYCNTNSEASYWKPLQIDFKCKLHNETAKTVFVGQFGDKRAIVESFGLLHVDGEASKAKIITEVKLPTGGTLEQLKLFFDGQILASRRPPGLKVINRMTLEANHKNILNSSGRLNIMIPKVDGSVTIQHAGTQLAQQNYNMQGQFTNQELTLRVHGTVDGVPIRSNLEYVDEKVFNISASYGSPTYASITMSTELEGFSLNFKKLQKNREQSKLISIGNVTFGKRETTFHHVFTVSKKLSSSSLRINVFRGRPLKIFLSRLKHALNEWKTNVKIEWGDTRFNYTDEVIFRGLKDFNVKSFLNAPAFDVRDRHFHIISRQNDFMDQTFSVKYTKELVTIHSGRFVIQISPLGTKTAFKINVDLTDLIIDEKAVADVRFKQYLALPEEGIELKSVLKRAETPLAEVILNGLDNRRDLLFSVCSRDWKCIRFNVNVQSVIPNDLSRSFIAEIRFLNSLLWKRIDEEAVEHKMLLSAMNEENVAKLSGRITRSLCIDKQCMEVSLLGKHKVHLSASTRNLECGYENLNRTVLLKTSLTKGINKKLDIEDSGELQIQFWFNQKDRPDDVINWVTSYQVLSSKIKVQELVKSSISHPVMTKPLEIIGKFSSVSDVRREGLIDVNLFEDRGKAFQLYGIKDFEDGKHSFNFKLKRVKEKHPHLSLSSTFAPTSGPGHFDLKFEAPLLSNQRNGSQDAVLKYHCDMKNQLKDNMEIDCQISTSAVSERFGGKLIQAPRHCNGAGGKYYAFDRVHEGYGTYCPDIFDISSGLSLSNYSEDLISLKLGYEDAETLRVNILDVLKGSLKLYAPFLLRGTVHVSAEPYIKISEIKKQLDEEWLSILSKSRDLSHKIVTEAGVISQSFEDVTHSQLIEEMCDVITVNAKNVLEEMRNDQLLQDIGYTIESVYNITSIVVEISIAFIEMSTGRSLSMNHLNHYINDFQKLIIDTISNIYSYILQGVYDMTTFVRGAVYEAVMYSQEFASYMVSESIISDAVKWMLYKTKSVINWNSWEAFFEETRRVLNAGLKIFYQFYPEIKPKEENSYVILVPLYRSSYNLKDTFEVQEKEKLYATKTLPEEIRKWFDLASDPIKFASLILPPYDGFGIISKNNLITFDGSHRKLDPTCSQLLFGYSRENKTEVALLTKPNPKNSNGRRKYSVLIGDEVIEITPQRNVIYTSNELQLPYHNGSISITRNIEEITVSASDDVGSPFFEFSCLFSKDICVIRVSGWLFSDTFGVFGSYDYNPFNDEVSDTVQNKTIWSDDGDCSLNNRDSSSGSIEESHLDICSQTLLKKDSSVVPCHNHVSVSPYYKLCLNALQNHPTTHHRTSNTTKNGVDVMLPNTSISNSFFEVEESKAICDVVEAYEYICSESDVDLKPLSNCKIAPQKHKLDISKKMLDVLLLTEEDDCREFAREFVVKSLPTDIRTLLKDPHDFNISLGYIGYGSSPGQKFRYYGFGTSLLRSYDEFTTPDLTKSNIQQGSLQELLPSVTAFPFRDESFRIALVASCTDQDLAEFPSNLVEEFRQKKIALFSLTQKILILNPSKPKRTRYIIGMNSTKLFHLKKGVMSQFDINNLAAPQSNLAHLALQTGGGVFSAKGIETTSKNMDQDMKKFRLQLIKAMFDSAHIEFQKSEERQLV